MSRITSRNGSHTFILELGTDPVNGKRKQRRVTVSGTLTEAKREQTRLQREIDTGGFVAAPDKLTLAAYLQQWLQDYAKINVSAKTYQTYEEFVRLHLVPGLGRLPLAKLTPLAIQAYYAEKQRSGRVDGKGGLSAQTVLHHHRVLREALQQAVRWQILPRNPADAVEPPKPRRVEPPTVDGDGSLALLEAAEGSWLYVPILLAVSCGLRRGETVALRWEDVNLAAGTLAVRRSLEETRQGLAFKAPKNGKSRVVKLPAFTIEALQRHRARQAELQLLLGNAWQNLNLVVCQDDGRLRSCDNLTKSFLKLRRTVGAEVTFHGLRHSHATILLSQGVQPKVVSERLGHSSISITQDLYAHVMPHIQEEAAAQVDKAFGAAVEKRRNEGPSKQGCPRSG